MSTPLRDLTAKISFKQDDGLAQFDKALDSTASRIAKMGAGLAGALGIGWGVREGVQLASAAEQAELNFAVATRGMAEGMQKNIRDVGKSIEADLSKVFQVDAGKLMPPGEADRAAAIFFSKFKPTDERMRVFETISTLASRHMILSGEAYSSSFQTMLDAFMTGNSSALQVFGGLSTEFTAVFEMVSNILKNDGGVGLVGMNANMERMNQLANELVGTLDPVLRSQKWEFVERTGLATNLETALTKLANLGLDLIAPAIERLNGLITDLNNALDVGAQPGGAGLPTTVRAAGAVLTGGELPEEAGANIPGFKDMSAREKAWAVFSTNVGEAMRGAMLSFMNAADPETTKLLQQRITERQTTALEGEALRTEQYQQMRGDVTFNIYGATDPEAVAETVNRLWNSPEVTTVTGPAERVPKAGK